MRGGEAVSSRTTSANTGIYHGESTLCGGIACRAGFPAAMPDVSTADLIMYLLLTSGVLGLAFAFYKYAKGLTGSPRELWLIFLYKFAECAGYGAIQLTLTLWLSKDCGLSDISAGNFITGYSLVCSAMGMVAGALVDTVGLKRITVTSIVLLVVARFFMSWLTTPVLAFLFGFMPMSLGFAIVAPVVSVGIKRFTTKEGAALGFALFYIIMNVGFAFGGFVFDKARSVFVEKDAAGKIINENLGVTLAGLHFSTYQLIFLFGTVMTVVSFALVSCMREGVERTETGVTITPPKKAGLGVAATIRKAATDTVAMLRSVATERYFWVFLGLIAMLLFVKSVFIHFHYTFPKYGIRVLGEGAKTGMIYGVLNPVLIIFTVPVVAAVTKSISSYRLMMVGSAVSAASCFIIMAPPSLFAPLTHTVLGELVFIKWLGMADSMQALLANPPSPEYWTLILFITVFTIGEAIWSPRFYQFTAEIAPRGKEATYLSLAVLPAFLSKFIVGPMSGLLLDHYTPVDAAGKTLPCPNHAMIWVWIGITACVTPIGLFFANNWFRREGERRDKARRDAEDEEAAQARA